MYISLIIISIFMNHLVCQAMENDEGAANPEGFAMVKMFAEEGDLESQKNLAHMYFEGDGVNKNLPQVLYWSDRILKNPESSEEDQAITHYRIGEIHLENNDAEKALKEFMIVFNSPIYDKMNDYELKDHAHLAIADILRSQKDNEGYIEIYQHLTNRDVPKVPNIVKAGAQTMLGNCYMQGSGIKPDVEQAIVLFRKALTNFELEKRTPHSEFYNNLGYAYEMTKKFEDALKYYTIASGMECEFAHLNLGYLYEQGLGTKASMSTASDYYERGKNSLDRWKKARGLESGKAI